MNDAAESPFKKARKFNFDAQEALGKELRDEALLWAQGSGVPKNVPKAIWGLATAYFKFHDEDSLEYLIDALDDEIELGQPILHEVDLRKLADELRSLKKTVDDAEFEMDIVKSKIRRLLEASVRD